MYYIDTKNRIWMKSENGFVQVGIEAKDKVTVIMISHDISSAVRYASHILHIGQNVFFGPTGDYVHSELARPFLAAKGGQAQ